MSSFTRTLRPSEDRFSGILQSRQNVLGNFRYQLLAPEWVQDVVIDDTDVLYVEGNVFLVRRHQHNRLLQGMGKAQLVEHVRVSACEFCDEDLRRVDP